jgi:hypothetical protein
VGKPNERERSYYSASGMYIIAAKSHFLPREIPHSTKQSPTIFCLGKRAQICTIVWPPLILCLENHARQSAVQLAQYDPATTRKLQKSASISVPKGCLESRALLAVWTIRIHIVWPNTEKIEQHYTQKIALGFVPSISLGKVPTKLLTFLFEALSKNLSQSPLDVSYTLPNAFFYNFENDIFPPKCLFTSKSKGQD